MHLSVKLITKWHPRGIVLEIEMQEDATVESLKQSLFAHPTLAECGSELFRGLVCVRNGATVSDPRVLEDGDQITFWKPISGG